jgi:D-alanyl-D-alanine carboxypeptidase (penicillin-binding protein 5/6)
VIPVNKQILASSETLGIKTEQITRPKVVEPILVDSATPPLISATSALVVDLDSDKTLFEKDSSLPVFPASTTKIITGLVALDTYPLSQTITVDKLYIDGQKMGLVSGEQIRVEDLIYGLLVESANDAAEVLADNYPGGRSMFIAAMNLKARELGLTNTLFVNPTGFDQEGQLTTAVDLIRASKYAIGIPEFAKIVATKTIIIKSVDGKFTHNLRNINRLLGEVDGVKGVKTGYTEGAKENLVTYVERDGKKIMIAVLGSQDRFGESKNLIEWIFTNYTWN